jgi:hypothetical protein
MGPLEFPGTCLLAIPAEAGTHFGHGYRPSPV